MAPFASERLSSGSSDIDLAHLARQTAGDEQLQREVLSLFRDQCARQLASMRAAGGGGRAARDAAHTLLGAARGVGAFRIAGIAERAETAVDNEFDAALRELETAAADAGALISRLLAGA